MKIKIDLGAGYNSQADTEDVKVTKSVNIETDKPGMIKKRLGRAISAYINGVKIKQLVRWDTPDGYLWIGYGELFNGDNKIIEWS